MNMVPSSPQSIGGILDTGLKLFVASLKKGWLLAFLCGFLINLPNMAFEQAFDPANAATDENFLVTFFPLFFGAIAVTVVFYNALLVHVANVATGSETSILATLWQGTKRWPAAIGVTILYLLAVMIGMLLLVIPGMFLSIALYAAYFLAVVNKMGPFAALRRSYTITKGSWWRVATVVTVSFIIVLVLTLLASFAGGMMGFQEAMDGGDASTLAMPWWMTFIVGPVMNGISYTALFGIQYALVKDLELRSSGEDLLARAEALEAG